MYVITVSPMDYGWSVRTPDLSGAMLFLTGGQAERAARGLGQRLARNGQKTKVEVFLKDGRMAGEFAF